MDRKDFYNEILRNKSIVDNLQNMDFIPSIEELSIVNYYSYRDIHDKIETFSKLKKLEYIDGIDDPDDDIIDEILNEYNNAFELLNDNDSIFIVTDVDAYHKVDKCFPECTDDYINIYNSIDDILSYMTEIDVDVFKVYITKKDTIKNKAVAYYGKMDDGKLHLYRIGDFNNRNYELRSQHPLPYDNDEPLGYYLPFMHNMEYIGKANISQDSFGLWYGFIENGRDISWMLCNIGCNIATYDIICEYIKYDIYKIDFSDTIDTNDSDTHIALLKYPKCKIIVYGAEGSIPHFHIENDNGFNCPICINENAYFEHCNDKDKLNQRQVKKLYDILKSNINCNGFGHVSVWKILQNAWVLANGDKYILDTDKMPNYINLNNHKPIHI